MENKCKSCINGKCGYAGEINAILTTELVSCEEYQPKQKINCKDCKPDGGCSKMGINEEVEYCNYYQPKKPSHQGNDLYVSIDTSDEAVFPFGTILKAWPEESHEPGLSLACRFEEKDEDGKCVSINKIRRFEGIEHQDILWSEELYKNNESGNSYRKSLDRHKPDWYMNVKTNGKNVYYGSEVTRVTDPQWSKQRFNNKEEYQSEAKYPIRVNLNDIINYCGYVMALDSDGNIWMIVWEYLIPIHDHQEQPEGENIKEKINDIVITVNTNLDNIIHSQNVPAMIFHSSSGQDSGNQLYVSAADARRANEEGVVPVDAEIFENEYGYASANLVHVEKIKTSVAKFELKDGNIIEVPNPDEKYWKYESMQDWDKKRSPHWVQSWAKSIAESNLGNVQVIVGNKHIGLTLDFRPLNQRIIEWHTWQGYRLLEPAPQEEYQRNFELL